MCDADSGLRPRRQTAVFQIVAKAPVPGFAKTRLIPALGLEGGARLQAALTLHTLQVCVEAARLSGATVELWCAPDCAHPFFEACKLNHAVTLHRQSGVGLGARMHAAIADGLTRARNVVLLGTDAPTLTADVLVSALGALQAGRDAVIVPAYDGGYVLIGLSRIDSGLFANISWGTSSVCSQTRVRLSRYGFEWLELPAHRDIDHPEDWRWLIETAPEWLDRIGDG